MTDPVTAATVSEEVFREVLEEMLFPLFPGTEFEAESLAEIPKRNKRKLVTQVGSGTDLKLMPDEHSEICLQIHRAQKFAADEKVVIGTFLDSVGRAYRDWRTTYGRDTAASVMSQTVAGTVAPDSDALVGQLISMMVSWAQQTYEGDRIAFSVGLDPEAADTEIAFVDIEDEDFLKVLSNGQDTLMVVNANGRLVRHATLTQPTSSGELMSPVRLAGLAQWTREDPERAAITLNRNGEILAFKQGALLFARRRGDWRYFPHESVIARFVKRGMANNSSANLRREIYRTALDAAFTRSGACIGVMQAHLTNQGIAALVDSQDQFSHGDRGLKASALAELIGDLKFQSLDRRLRLELVSVDGATILGHDGTVLAVGAILKIGAGSAGGGGCEAASRALAKYGLGIKVSNDGYIRARNRDGDVIVEMA